MDHTFHSETAKNAVGTAAKPPPRKSFGRGTRSRASSRNKKPFSKNNQSGKKPKHNFKRR